MRKIAKAIGVAFSMYSKIPMPHFVWASEDMRYHLLFFPWIGAVIGGLEIAWYHLRSHSSHAKLLLSPGAMFLAIIAASIGIVPEPHMGSYSILFFLQ